MKPLIPIVLVASAALLGGCNDAPVVTDVPNPERVERKPFDKMSVDEKVNFIQHTPMSEEAKQKQIAAIRQGRG